KTPDIAADEPSALERVISVEDAAALSGALREIPDQYRLPLILFYQEQQSVKNVAAALDLSVESVKKRLFRGRRMLQVRIAVVEAVAPRLRRGMRRRKLVAGLFAVLATGKRGSAEAARSHSEAVSGSKWPALWSVSALGVALCSLVYFPLRGGNHTMAPTA